MQLTVKDRSFVGDECAPLLHGERESFALRNESPSLQIGECLFVWGDHAGSCAGLDAHVAYRHAAFHRKSANGRAGIFDDIARRAIGANAADDIEDDVLRGDAIGQLAFHVDAEGLRFGRLERLGRHNVFDLTGTDAEGQCTEGTVRGGV